MSDSAPLDLAPEDEEPAEPPPSKARVALLKRLADVVCLPSSRVNAFERAVTADLLVEILREAEVEERARVARRLANLSADAIEALVATTRQIPELIGLLLKRPELRPSHAYILFWWADAEAR